MIFQAKINRALENVKSFISNQLDYSINAWNCSGFNSNIVSGVSFLGKPITIVVRPTDGNEVIFYSNSEKDVLEDAQTQLWGENGSNIPFQITIGRLVKRNDIS